MIARSGMALFVLGALVLAPSLARSEILAMMNYETKSKESLKSLKAPVAPAERAEGIPPLLSDLCLWMLAKNADDRPQNYEEVRQALNTVTGGVR